LWDEVKEIVYLIKAAKRLGDHLRPVTSKLEELLDKIDELDQYIKEEIEG